MIYTFLITNPPCPFYLPAIYILTTLCVEMQQAQQQQQIEHENQQLRIQEEEKMRLEGTDNNSSRPEEHFLTIALNGTYFI